MQRRERNLIERRSEKKTKQRLEVGIQTVMAKDCTTSISPFLRPLPPPKSKDWIDSVKEEEWKIAVQNQSSILKTSEKVGLHTQKARYPTLDPDKIYWDEKMKFFFMRVVCIMTLRSKHTAH